MCGKARLKFGNCHNVGGPVVAKLNRKEIGRANSPHPVHAWRWCSDQPQTAETL